MVRRLWAEQPELLYECSYDDVQDAAHGVFLDAWSQWVKPAVSGLGTFGHRYVTNGSSEAIRETIWNLGGSARARGLGACLHVFAGEYEGYAAYARAAGITVVTHDRTKWRDEQIYTTDALHAWYVSQPSATDGNVWPELPELIATLAERNVTIAVDLAYVGAAPKLPHLDLSSPNVAHVFFSLSKVFGVFYHRVGGVLSRQPLLGLEGNKWFKNIFSLYLGTSLIREAASPRMLATRYQRFQVDACRLLREEHGIPLTPSDAILLATSPLGNYPINFRRGPLYRWCLTPTMDRLMRDELGESSAHA
jgi:histidinol-phosphate/aromatic aminotransferase/cobyric acid decarboxylase-like protein